ncbi:hypothetical protein KPH14_001764 [Odynerus spinipes]|uniref:Cytochrome P450 n=1 Tax=Odynerus spinipes TaxID=1348599 RepID=A0AAD9S1M0_9HYME|nr:hypothetical protein KPH14_001764 [Odynerus spinipes]
MYTTLSLINKRRTLHLKRDDQNVLYENGVATRSWNSTDLAPISTCHKVKASSDVYFDCIQMYTMRAGLKFCNLDHLPAIKKPLQHRIKNAAYSIEACRVEDNSDSFEHARPFEDIPGPKPIWILGNSFRFLPLIGEYGDKTGTERLQMLREHFGDIVKMEGLPNKRKSVFLFSPTLIEKMYRTEGTWPMRIAMESLHYYRLNRDWIYHGKYGLTTSQGKDWHDFRTKVNKHMIQPRAINPHVQQIDEIAAEFVEKIRDELRDPSTLELPASFNNEMNKWALESIGAIAVNHRLGCLKSDLAEGSEPQKMINCIHEMFSLMFKLELMPSLWRLYQTRSLKRFFYILDTINEIAIKYIHQAKERMHNKTESNSHEKSVLEKLLAIDEQTAYVMALDMFTAGVDTTSNACGSMLYHLSVNPRVQEKLHEEAKAVLPEKGSPITLETLKNVPYLKACLKESHRLSPISIGTLRTAQSDIVLAGYKIPKGSDLIAGHALLSIDPTEFERPNEFIPERWIRNGSEFLSAKNAHPFSYMPFGFGARTCIGKRFAELEIEVLVLKLIRNFRLEWHHQPMKWDSYLINTIASPLKFKLIDL